MPRATVIIDVNTPGEREMFEQWLATWQTRLSYVSNNEGCGCCVDIYNVEGPQEAIDTLPQHIRSTSDWTHPPQPSQKKERRLP